MNFLHFSLVFPLDSFYSLFVEANKGTDDMTEAELEYAAQEVCDEVKSDYGSYYDHALSLHIWVENGVGKRCVTDANETDHWIEIGRLEQ
jgi:hypothetical protein